MKPLRSFLILCLLALSVSSLQAQFLDVPAEGMILSGGKKLTYVTAGKAMVSSSARVQSEPIADMRAMLTRPPRGLYRLERNRQHYRDKELSRLQVGTIGKGVLTELLYKKGRKHAEKSKANSEQGKGSSSGIKSLLKGLFK